MFIDKPIKYVRNPTRRQAAEALGRGAENCVVAHWQAQGFSILARRLRTKAGEIDMIVADASNLVFVEVKCRKTFTKAAHAVLPRQQARIFKAAETALADHQDWQRSNTRFDIALVSSGSIQHIRDAIRAF